MQKKFTAILSLLLLLCIVLSLPVNAADSECTVTVATVTANPQDTVFVPITIQNNPGISAVTATITYDAAALQYVGFTKGAVFTDSFLVKDHPDKNNIKFTVLESSKDTVNNGDILTLQFTVQKNATAGLHKIGIAHQNGDFANRKMESIVPKIITGGVQVKDNTSVENCTHKNYSAWTAVVNATCTAKGAEQRECLVCGKKETRETDKIPHDYETQWTVDSPATKTKDGVMSRHCKHCTAKTQVLTFTYKEVNGENMDNQIGAEVTPGSLTENLVKDQYPQAASSAVASSKVSASSKATAASQNISSAPNQTESPEETQISAGTESETSSNGALLKTNSKNKVITILGIIALICIFGLIGIVATRKTKK